MTAWIILVSGCFVAAMGTLTLNGWRPAQSRQPRKAGWGVVAMGGGLALDGVPRLVGWSSGVGVVLSTVAMGLVVLGVVLHVRGGVSVRARRRDKNG
jgi:hypothetical protein